MARKKQETQETQEKKTLTRAQKTEATKVLIKELLAFKPMRHNELLEEVAKNYVSNYEDEDAENINNVKGRIGSVLDIMKKESDIMYDGGMYALKARLPMSKEMQKVEAKAESKETVPQKKTTRSRVKKADAETQARTEKGSEKRAAETSVEKSAETPAPKKRSRAKKAVAEVAPVEKQVEVVEETPAEKQVKVAEVTPVENRVEKIAETPVEKQEKATAKKRGRKPKAKVLAEEKKAELIVEEKTPVAEEPAIEEKKRAVAPVAVEMPVQTEEKMSVKAETLSEKETEVSAKVESVAKSVPVAEKEPVKIAEKESETEVSAKGESVAKSVPVAEKEAVKVAEKEPDTGLIMQPKGEIPSKSVVMDMSFLFGDKATKAAQKPAQSAPSEKKAEGKAELPASSKTTLSAEKSKEGKGERSEEKKAPMSATNEKKPVPERVKTEEKSTEKKTVLIQETGAKKELRSLRMKTRKADKPQTPDEKLKESFLKRMRALGGDYFEYYSVYLLERYSMKNGRRLEGMRISGGERDGGIDGEIELTDKFGFRETIYIQSKNWDPEKGREENWVVGETLLQQFIGACACRQAKEGKQHTRGIFITTSRFTPDAKRILNDMSEKIIGYDGDDLYEAAKECEFGIVRKNGEWALDEKLLSGAKAFFEML